MPRQARIALVVTLQDILSAFPTALGKLPSNPQVLKCQRAVTVLATTLKDLEGKL